MAARTLKQVREALADLNPSEVRVTAERRLALHLVASSSPGYAAMEEFFSPASASPGKQLERAQALFRNDEEGTPGEFDLEIYEARLPRPETASAFYSEEPERTVREILDRFEELSLPLARYFEAFRGPVINKAIHSISRENALFSIATALPNIAPSLATLPWAVAEFGSGTAFLTVNQIRMLFLIGAASDRPVGYREQRSEIASVIAGAFGWRALARELAGKIPFGGGIVPKAAVAFAGTYVVGRSAERLYRIGYAYTRKERRLAYEEAFDRGKQVAASLLKNLLRRRQQERPESPL